MNQRIFWDCHMHSSFSSDSATPMECMIMQAISSELHGICFTEHLDPDYPKTPDGLTFSVDLPLYKETCLSLKEKSENHPIKMKSIKKKLPKNTINWFLEKKKKNSTTPWPIVATPFPGMMCLGLLQ